MVEYIVSGVLFVITIGILLSVIKFQRQELRDKNNFIINLLNSEKFRMPLTPDMPQMDLTEEAKQLLGRLNENSGHELG